MLIIGLLGGVASGKSHVASEFRRLGAAVVSGDALGHEVLRLPDCRAAISERFGGQVLDAAGEVNRAAVARLVFGSEAGAPAALDWLEQLTHPRIRARIRQELMRWAVSGAAPAAVLDAPVLLKAGWNAICDQIVFVETRLEVRQARARQRGWNADELARRETSQTPLAEKRARATAVIENSGSPAQTASQVEALWRQWGL